MTIFKHMLIIGLGGFLGSIGRYLLQLSIGRVLVHIFPYGTLVVNIIGCFLLGLIYGLAEQKDIFNHEWRLFLAIGFCGSFTTFSTFAFENLQLFNQNAHGHGLLYILLSVVLGIAAAYWGFYVVRGI